MKIYDVAYLGILTILAFFIWFRDTAWISSADDTLPILVSLPLFVWLGMPWKLRKDDPHLSVKSLSVAVIIFLAGIAIDMTLLLAVGWTLLLWTWLSVRVSEKKRVDLSKLLVLPLMAFPWITLDASRIGWWFRLSGAWCTAKTFSLLGFEVTYWGTNVNVNNLPISIEAACSGLNTLQSLLIAGVVIAYLLLRETSLFWWNLPVLFAMAWIANTVRIMVLTASALFVSPAFALGAFHTIGGWLILLFMFSVCWMIFSLQQPKTQHL